MTNIFIIYVLCGLAGFSDGLNDCVIALRFYHSSFWGVNWYKNKEQYGWLRRELLTFTCDGWHLTKFITPVFYCVALAMGVHAAWWNIIVCYLATRAGRWLAYDVLFRKK